MASQEVQRKLTAILCADVAGYSRLMGDDEEATIETLTAYRKVFVSQIESRRGRVVDAKGDAILVEFASVVDAVKSAVEIQRELAGKNAELPDDRRMDFRIGINLGDVVVKDDVIYGDGVNIAARLESLAEPGGICISRPVYDQVKAKLELDYDYLGEQEVKNIAEPVRAYKVLTKPGDAAHRLIGAKRKLAAYWRKIALAAAVLVVLGTGGFLGWNYYQQRASEEAVAAFEKEVDYPLPEKPSIAVLAFENMSGDKEQEYFSDGFSEDIITDLSKISGISVVARNSSFAYKGKAVNAQQMGRELGVQYLLEGSVQRADNRIRISAQLIDAATGNHLWAERYVRQATDLFAVQDEIVQRIVTALKVNLTMDEVAQVRFKTTDNVAAWNHYLRGQKLFRQSRSAEMQLARVEYGKALILDPDFESALLGLGWSYLWEDRYGTGFGAPDPRLMDRAAALAGRTLALNDTLAEPYALLGLVYLSKRQHGEAVSYARQAVTAEPSGAEWRMHLASNLSYAGKLEEALAEIGKAMELNPFPTDELLSTAARIYYQAGQYGQAIRIAKGLTERRGKIERSPIWTESHLFLIAAYSAAGRLEEARAAAVEYNQRRRMKWPPKPKIYILYFMRFKEQAEIDRLLADLAKAGLPE